MTKQRSPLSSGSGSKPAAGDKGEANEVTGPEAMKRFKALARNVVAVPNKAVKALESAENRKKPR